MKICKVYVWIQPRSSCNKSETCAFDVLYTCGSRKIFRKLIFSDRCAIFIVLHLPEAADAENATDLLNSLCMRASCALLANSPLHRAAATPAYYILKICKVYVLIRAASDLLIMRASCTLWGKSSRHRAVVALSVLHDLSARLVEIALYARLVRAFGKFAAASCSFYTGT